MSQDCQEAELGHESRSLTPKVKFLITLPGVSQKLYIARGSQKHPKVKADKISKGSR